MQLNTTRLLLLFLFVTVLVHFAIGQTATKVDGMNYDFELAVDAANLASNPRFIKLDKSYEEAKHSESDSLVITSLLALSEYTQTIQNYSSAFEYSGEALYLAEELKDTLLLARACQAFGVLNYLLYQKSDSRYYLEKSLELHKQLYKQGKIKIYRLVSAYFSVTLYYRHFEQFNESLSYLDSCYFISDTITTSAVNKAYLDVEKGILFCNTKRAEEALLPLNKAKKVFEGIKANDAEVSDKGYLVIVYAYLGIVHKKLGNYSASRNYFQKSLSILDINKKHIDLKPFIHEQYGLLLYSIGEYRYAYEHLTKSNKINERYFSTKAISNNDFITIRSRYKDEINAKNDEIIKQSLELARNKQSIIMFQAILYSIILLLIIGGLIVRSRYQLKKHKKEKLLNLQKQRDSEELLELKNKELTGFTLKLIEKEEMLLTVRNHLQTLDGTKETKSLLTTLKHNESSLWEDFNNRFIAVNKDFYKNLQKKFPELSPGDLKICALIKLNFSGKEMAHLLGISIDSVHKARHRLRKKMDLDRNVNLTSYISAI